MNQITLKRIKAIKRRIKQNTNAIQYYQNQNLPGKAKAFQKTIHFQNIQLLKLYLQTN